MQLLSPRVPLKEQMFFVQHLNVMLKASIPIDQALGSLAGQTKNKAFRKILEETIQNVQKGKPLSESISKYQKVFGDFFINIIAAGEQTGKLVEALARLHRQMRKDYDLKSKVKSALAYPIFVIIAMIGIGTGIMLFVVPKLLTLFQGFEDKLPIATRILISISKVISQYSLWIALGLIISTVALIKLIQGPGKKYWHNLLLHLPGISQLTRGVNLARFSRTFSSLLGTDLLLVTSLEVTSKVLGNIQYKEAVLDAQKKIQQGMSISDSFKAHENLFPPTALTMIRVGEQSGTLAELLDDVAEFYEEQVDDFTKTISSIIEPALIVMLGLAVGGMALAILMPMYTLMQQV